MTTDGSSPDFLNFFRAIVFGLSYGSSNLIFPFHITTPFGYWSVEDNIKESQIETFCKFKDKIIADRRQICIIILGTTTALIHSTYRL